MDLQPLTAEERFKLSQKKYRLKYRKTERGREVHNKWSAKPKECIYCDTTIGSGVYARHCKSQTHKLNEKWFVENCFK